MEFVERTVREAMEMLDNGEAQQKILAHLATAAETISDGSVVSSILVLDEKGLLRNGASPKLPADYLKAIDGIAPKADVGTCAAAAATGRMVVTTDFNADNKWKELRHLPTALGFQGAWSMPIKNTAGRVLGTFGTYFRERRKPSPKEISGVAALADAAARVLESAA